jgi:hypothetical protein
MSLDSAGRERSACRAQRHRLLVVLPVMLAVLGVAPLGHSAPPDPLWIPGSYDAGDLDLALSAAAAPCLAVSPHRLVKVSEFVAPPVAAAEPPLAPRVSPASPERGPAPIPARSSPIIRSPPAWLPFLL